MSIVPTGNKNIPSGGKDLIDAALQKGDAAQKVGILVADSLKLCTQKGRTDAADCTGLNYEIQSYPLNDTTLLGAVGFLGQYLLASFGIGRQVYASDIGSGKQPAAGSQPVAAPKPTEGDKNKPTDEDRSKVSEFR